MGIRISHRTGRNTAVTAGPGTWIVLGIGMACVLAFVGLWVLIAAVIVGFGLLVRLVFRSSRAGVVGYRAARREQRRARMEDR